MTSGKRPVLAVVWALASGCSASGTGGGASNVLAEPPPSADFASVADALDLHCGALDCHGKVTRNLKLYGRWGLRLDAVNVPGCGTATPREIAADYWSLVGLEPELTADVLADHGADPERLTLVRKSRGTEKHTGGTVFAEGTPGDTCLVSFLSGAVDGPTCRNVLQPTSVLLVPRCAPAGGSAP